MRRGTPRRSEQNQSLDEEIGKIPEQLPVYAITVPYGQVECQVSPGVATPMLQDPLQYSFLCFKYSVE